MSNTGDYDVSYNVHRAIGGGPPVDAARADAAPPSTLNLYRGDLSFVAPASHEFGGVATSYDGLPIPAERAGLIGGGGSDDFATKAAAQEFLHDNFLGVIQTPSPKTHPQVPTVSRSGRYLFPCVSADYVQGQLVGASVISGGTQLDSRKVEGVAAANLAIGVVVEGGTGLAAVVIDIVSSKGAQRGVQDVV